KTWICPGDPRVFQAWYDTVDVTSGYMKIAFTTYLAVSGTRSGMFDGAFFWNSQVAFKDITDGTSTTFFVGERPPSHDLEFGWWFAGAGYDGNSRNVGGTGDVIMGSRETGYAASMGCASSYANFKAGKLIDPCDQVHFWSVHPSGANFL